MKILIIKKVIFSFNPAEPHAHFKVDEVHDLPDERSSLLIKYGYAKKFEEKVKHAEKMEEKMLETKFENKMMDINDIENKSSKKTKKNRGRPRKD